MAPRWTGDPFPGWTCPLPKWAGTGTGSSPWQWIDGRAQWMEPELKSLEGSGGTGNNPSSEGTCVPLRQGFGSAARSRTLAEWIHKLKPTEQQSLCCQRDHSWREIYGLNKWTWGIFLVMKWLQDDLHLHMRLLSRGPTWFLELTRLCGSLRLHHTNPTPYTTTFGVTCGLVWLKCI